MKGDPVVKNALWLMAGRVAQLALSLLVTLLTARYFGPENFGLLSYAAAYTGFFSALAGLGLQSVLVRELTEHGEKEGELLGTALFLRLFAGIASAVAMLCIVSAAERGDPLVLAVAGASGLGMAVQSFDVFHCRFQAKLRSRVTAAVLLAAHALTAGWKAAGLIWGKGVLWFAFASAVEQLGAAVLLLAAYRGSGGLALTISRETARELFDKSRHFILPGLMVAVYAQTDRIMLGRLMGGAETGYYSAAVSVCNAWCFVLSAIIDSMYPEIVKAHAVDGPLFRRRNRQLYTIIFYLSAAVSMVISVGAEPLVGLLYGEGYLPAAGVLRLLTWYTGFSYLGVARNAWVVCENRQSDLLRVYVAAAAANVGLNFLLIPRWGAAGAAAASLVSQVVSAVAAPLCIRGLRENGKLMLEAILRRGETP